VRLTTGLAAAFAMTVALAAPPRALASPAPPAPAPAGWRLGSAPRLPGGTRALGALAGSTSVDATVTLAPRDPPALATYAQAVATPGSAVYHRYLTVAQFAQRFGPKVSDVDLARASLAAAGLNPGPSARDGLSIAVRSSAARLASAFSTSFDRYRLADGRTAYANRAAPSVPSDMAGVVQGIIGLDSLARRTPAATPSPGVTPGAAQPCSPATAAAGTQGHTADGIAAAYRLNGLYGAGDLGAGTTVALYELEPYTPSDVAAYQSCLGTHASVSTVSVDGGPGTTTQTGEAALDIEDVIGLAPRAAFAVYQGRNGGSGPLDTYAKIVNDDTAQVISTSWGLCESDVGPTETAAENVLFQEAAVQGQSVVAAAGDSGAADCGTSTQAVDDPASQPYVTGAGGTTLSSTQETVWDNSGGGAGGGGVSSLWPAPSYQAGAASPQTSTTCGASGYACRQVPDVSADADPQTGYPIYYRGAWRRVGGTSAAAPTWAALLALADASASCAGKPVGFANPNLYAAARTGYASAFTDIVSGTNTYRGVTGFSAATGYDMASGLGSPRGAVLAGALCVGTVDGSAPGATATTTGTPGPVTPPPTAAAPSPLPTIRFGSSRRRTGRVGIRQRLSAPANDSAGLALRYAAAGLPAGLRIDPRSGVISGIPTRAGISAVTLTATDSRGAGARAGFRWTIAGRPAVPAGSLRLDRSGRPVLTLTIAAGARAAPVRRVAITAPAHRLRFAAPARARAIAARSGGHRVAAPSRVQRTALVVTLRPASRRATITVVSPRVSLKGSRGPSLRLSIVVTDAAGIRTRLSVRIASA
jgi:hypothetical protein